MRVSALIQLSALAACPLALFSLNATGDSRVPSQPTIPSSNSEESPPEKDLSAIADGTTTVAPPETFETESQKADRLFLLLKKTASAETAETPKPSPAAESPDSKLYHLQSHRTNQPTNPPPLPLIATPERLNLPWDRIVARSVGLDEPAAATVMQTATAPTVSPTVDSSAAPALAVGSDDPAVQAAPETPPAVPSADIAEVPPETPPAVMSEVLAEVLAEGTAQVTPPAAPQPPEPPVAAAPQPIVPAAEPLAQTQQSENAIESATLASLPVSVSQPVANPIPAAAVEQSYRLGAGDLLQVNLFNVPEYSGQQRVLVDGTVNLPVVGNVLVAGMTLSETEQAIAAAYSRELRNIRVTVSLAQSRPLRVGVVGEVRQPGYYVMDSTDTQLPSVAQAIQTAGGVTQLADLRQVQVRRTNQTGVPQTITINLWALLEQGDPSQNLILRDGDTILIAPSSSMTATETEQLAASNLASSEAQSFNVALVGEVGRPGAYKLESSSGNRATLTQAIQAAGGVTPEADLRKVLVQRTARNGTVQATTLDLWQLVTTGDLSQDLILQPGDRITIAKAEAMTPEEMARVTGSNVSPSNIRVNVVGEAANPGAVQVPANTTLNQALLAAGGFNRRARSTVQLIRINPNGTLTQRSIEVDLDRPVDSENNPILFNNDVVLVGRSGLASFTDGANSILEPIFRILPIFGLF